MKPSWKCSYFFTQDFKKLFQVSAIIQLMHYFEVDIRICQPKNSNVHRGEAEVNVTFVG